jgi:hypothetical protein
MTGRARAHAIAGIAVTCAISAYGFIGGIQTDYGPAAVVVIALLLTSVAAAVTFAVSTYQAGRGKRDVVRPVVWAAIVAWVASLVELQDHPVSFRSAQAVLSSVLFACMLLAPFAAYWILYHVVERVGRGRSGVA